MHVSFRTVALALASAALGVAASVLYTALTIGPAPSLKPFIGEGDLTRLGWYSNPRYAPSLPQTAFEPPLITVGGYDRYYDVVVLGDSYSTSERFSWANLLAAQGWRVLVHPPASTPNRELDVDALVASPAYQAAPPRLMIYQSVERELPKRFRTLAPQCDAAVPPLPDVTLPAPRAITPHTVPVLPDLRTPFDAAQIGFGRDFLLANLRRPFAKNIVVYRTDLAVLRFSSARPATLLYYSEDRVTPEMTPALIERVRCGLLSVQRRIEAPGRTRFVAMIAPDKLSSYARDIARESPSRGSVVPRLVDPRLRLLRLDLALRSAIERGTLDVYLPNDTHWGAAGHRIAADTTLAFLQDLARPPRSAD
jgi:hypothetical protein